MASRNAPQKVRMADLTQKALELRKAGHTFEAIGKACGCSKKHAFMTIQKALQQLNAECSHSAEEYRRMELERLDEILESLHGRRDDPRVADTILRVMERRARLLGLDAPQKVAETNAAGEDLSAEDRAVLRARLLGQG